jgi:hypothetical protein
VGDKGWAIWGNFTIDSEAKNFALEVGKMVEYSNIPSGKFAIKELHSEDMKKFDPLGESGPPIFA